MILPGDVVIVVQGAVPTLWASVKHTELVIAKNDILDRDRMLVISTDNSYAFVLVDGVLGYIYKTFIQHAY